MDRLKGKITLITGGTSGIGAATAKLFQADGATVIVTGASENSVNAAKQAMPGIEVVHSNAGDTQAAQQLVQSVAQKHGKIDILFVNAGIARVAPAANTEERQFDELFATNVVCRSGEPQVESQLPCSRQYVRWLSHLYKSQSQWLLFRVVSQPCLDARAGVTSAVLCPGHFHPKFAQCNANSEIDIAAREKRFRIR